MLGRSSGQQDDPPSTQYSKPSPAYTSLTIEATPSPYDIPESPRAEDPYQDPTEAQFESNPLTHVSYPYVLSQWNRQRKSFVYFMGNSIASIMLLITLFAVQCMIMEEGLENFLLLAFATLFALIPGISGALASMIHLFPDLQGGINIHKQAEGIYKASFTVLCTIWIAALEVCPYVITLSIILFIVLLTQFAMEITARYRAGSILEMIDPHVDVVALEEDMVGAFQSFVPLSEDRPAEGEVG